LKSARVVKLPDCRLYSSEFIAVSICNLLRLVPDFRASTSPIPRAVFCQRAQKFPHHQQSGVGHAHAEEPDTSLAYEDSIPAVNKPPQQVRRRTGEPRDKLPGAVVVKTAPEKFANPFLNQFGIGIRKSYSEFGVPIPHQFQVLLFRRSSKAPSTALLQSCFVNWCTVALSPPLLSSFRKMKALMERLGNSNQSLHRSITKPVPVSLCQENRATKKFRAAAIRNQMRLYRNEQNLRTDDGASRKTIYRIQYLLFAPESARHSGPAQSHLRVTD